MTEEEIIYSDSAIVISTSRVVIGGTTYAVRNITSVKTDIVPASNGGGVAVIVLGIFCLGGLESVPRGGTLFWAIVCWSLICLVAGIWSISSAKNDFVVMIASSSGETKALVSKQRAHVEAVVEAINVAIVHYR